MVWDCTIYMRAFGVVDGHTDWRVWRVVRSPWMGREEGWYWLPGGFGLKQEKKCQLIYSCGPEGYVLSS